MFTDYLMSARLWFESFQNWQSEFLSIASMLWRYISDNEGRRNRNPCARRMTRQSVKRNHDGHRKE